MQNLEERIQGLEQQEGGQKERPEAWGQTLREEFKTSIKENTQVEAEDKIKENQPKGIRKQSLFYQIGHNKDLQAMIIQGLSGI